MEIPVIISSVGVVATLTGALVGYRFGRRSEFAVADWMRELRSWAAEVIDILHKAVNALQVQQADSSDSCSYSQRLSALIEIGRFYLPNQRQTEHGTEKPKAYQGYRHAALDPLVAAVRVIDGNRKYKHPSDIMLIELRREFVSAIFQILGPEYHNKEIARIIRTSHKSRTNDMTVGGLLQGEEIPPGATALLQKVVLNLNK